MASYSVFFNRWLNRLYKSIAILLVLFAVILSAFRLFLPYAHNYKTDFENYINNQYQANISVGHITMGWGKFGPTLIAEQVRVLKTRDTEVDIGTIDVRVDFWQSLSQRTLVADHITLSGMTVFIDKTVSEQTVAPEQVDNEQVLLDNLVDLFLTQISRFSLTDSEIVVRKNEDTENTFLINHLNWLNSGERHQASGDVRIGGLSSDHLKLLIDLQGGDKSKLDGQIYLQANQLNITPWLDSIFVIENEKTDSDINFDAWLTYKKGLAQSLQVKLGDNQVSWRDKGIEQSVDLTQGHIMVKRDHSTEHGFNLTTSSLNLSVNDLQWRPLTVEVNQNQQGLFAYVSDIDLASTAQVIPLLVEQEKTRKLIAELDLKGHLSEVQFQVQDDQVQALASFSDTSTEFSQGIPGMDNLSGDILFSKDTLKITLSATDGALDFDKHFIKPIPYNAISSEVLVRFQEQGITLDATDVKLASDELTLSADVRVSLPSEGLAEMALLASVKDGDASVAEHYYPHLLMGENLVNYLNTGIVDGKIAQAQVLFNGPFAKFPFTEPEGIFVVDAELTDGTFVFDSKWPAIENFSANLNFTNNGMLITGRAGQLTGLDVTGVEAAIADFGKGILTVDVDINKAAPEHVTNLMLASSLKDSVGATLEHVKISKPISGWFNLNLPLKNVEQVVASGLVQFNNNDIAIAAPQMNFSGATGELSFKNDVIAVNGLNANWLGMPMTLSAKAEQVQDYYNTAIEIDALWQQEQWQQHVPELMQSYSEGALAWQGKLDLHNHQGGGFSYDLTIDSNLKQAQLNLPAPYFKAIDDEKMLHVKVDGHLEQSTFNATLGEQLSFYGVLEHQNAQFSRSHLVLGDEQMLLPMDGFHITTKLEQASLAQWQPFITDILDTLSSEAKAAEEPSSDLLTLHQPPTPKRDALFPVPERIRGTIAELDVIGQPLNHVSFNLLDKQSWWLLQFNAKEARTQIKFYPNWLEQGIDVNADFIHLPANEEDTNQDIQNTDALAKQISQTKDQQLSPQSNHSVAPEALVQETLALNDKVFANMPPVSFHSDSLKVGYLDLGAVDFTVERQQPDKLVIKQFRAQRNKSELTFDMDWEHNQQGSKTQLIGELSVHDVETELEKFNYASMTKESGGEANFAVSWQGAPQDYSLSLINGSLSVNLDDGYLADVGDSARLFSVLSLQSLVRKLTLDFRDIFSDGMFYSSINGDFDLKDGYLYTNNVKMNGAAGDLIMKGNTNLELGGLDYSLSYKPNLTSSLPVLAWIATLQPAVFLAGIAIDQVMTSQVVSEFNFELTGTIDEPNFKEVNRKTMDISVGRSTPPTVVDNSAEPLTTPDNAPIPAEASDGSKDKIKTKNLYQENNYLQGDGNG
ncbi:YhdP family protein [Thalassotalea sp. PLHSN55]|uniref:YhdP family protein n=1 Tax=Thalassotalea sp. PLHSN55 TaxID=3435888 RepID=UPI003F872382